MLFRSGSRAYEDSHHFAIQIEPAGGRAAAGDGIPIEFRSGPFNWSEYGTKRSWFPWSLAPRDRGLLYDADGIRLEVLDFYADSTAALAPSVKLRIGNDAFGGQADAGRGMWMPVEVAWQPDPLRSSAMRHRANVGGGTVVFWKIAAPAEAEAFLAGLPDPALGYGEKGQLVLVADGRAHRFRIDDVLGKERFPIEGTDLFVEVTDYQERLSAVRLKVRRGAEGRDEEMVVLADLPEVTIHAPRSLVYGTLWIERAAADASERMQGKTKSRIDIVQAPAAGSQRLLYRRWQQPTADAGTLPTDGSPVPAFAMPMGKLEMRVDRFLPADTLEIGRAHV